MKRIAVSAFLTLFPILPSLAAEPPKASEILERAREAYTHLKSYDIVAAMLIETKAADFEQTIRSKLLMAAENPGKFRVEMRGLGGLTTVSDGHQTWTHNAMLKQYTVAQSAASVTEPLSNVFNLPLSGGGPPTESAKPVREETLDIGGIPHPCYVLDIAGPPPVTVWVDKNLYLILKRTSEQHMDSFPVTAGPADMKTTILVESLKTGEPESADRFQFKPPANAKLVESFNYPGMKKSDLEGKPAPEFHLSDLQDKPFRLADQRGKVVLLNFWATWCGPCRQEMPVLKRIHAEDKNVIVVGVNEGEDADVVQKFVQDNQIPYPILRAPMNDAVVTNYGAQALPTVVIIDAEGRVRTHKVGYSQNAFAELETSIAAARKPAPIQVAPAMPKIEPGSGVYRIGGGVSAPNVIFRREPAYTEQARRAKFSGTVVLYLVVSENGTPRDVKVLRGLGYGLDEQALEAVSSWRFKPGMKDGKPVAVQAQVEVNFRLLDGPTVPAVSAAAIEDEPVTAEAAYRRALRPSRVRTPDEAIALLGKAIEMKPEWAAPLAERGIIEYRQKRYAEAIHDLDSAIAMDASHAAWYNYRGLAYSNSGRHERALEDYTRGIEIGPKDSAFGYNNRGWAYLELGQLEKALPDLTKAIQISPGYLRSYENRARVYAKMADWKNAIADYTAAIELNPTRWQYEQRAQARQAMGDAEGTAEDLRRAGEMPRQSAPQQ